MDVDMVPQSAFTVFPSVVCLFDSAGDELHGAEQGIAAEKMGNDKVNRVGSGNVIQI